MKIYKSLFILFLFFLQNLSAKNHPELIQMPRLVFMGEFSCSLAPPSSLTVDAVGSDWVEVSWPAMTGVAQFRLEPFDGVNGDPVGSAKFVDGQSTSATVSTEGNQGSVYVRIWSVCENGDYTAALYTQSDTVDTIIIDIVASGFVMPAYNSTKIVGVGAGNGVEVSWTGDYAYFNVQYVQNGNFYGRRFALYVKANSNPDRVTIPIGESGNEGENLVFLEELNGAGDGVKMIIGFRSDPNTPPESATILTKLAASFAGGSNTTGKWFKTMPGNPSCRVEKTVWLSDQSPGEESAGSVATSELGINTASLSSARPNPFSSTVTIKLPEKTDPSETILHLYDIMGKQRMRYQVPAGQTECTLHTAQLPAGVYFLQIESGGKMEKLKLVKTQ